MSMAFSFLLALFACFLEAIVIPSIFQSVFFLDLKFYLVLYLLLLFFLPRRPHFTHLVYVFWLPLTALLYLLANGVAAYFSPDYLISHFHVHPTLLILPVSFCMLTIFSLSLPRPAWQLRTLPSTIVFGCLLYIFLLSSQMTAVDVPTKLKFLLKPELRTSTDKLRAAWPVFYDYVTFVAQNTPENATIVHPPQQSPWDAEGNQLLLRSFLFPRHLISAPQNTYSSAVLSADYLLLTDGLLTNSPTTSLIWPKTVIPISSLVLFSTRTVSVSPHSLTIDHRPMSFDLPKTITLSDQLVHEEDYLLLGELAGVHSAQLVIEASDTSIASLTLVGTKDLVPCVYEGQTNRVGEQAASTLTLDVSSARRVFAKAGCRATAINLKVTLAKPLPFLHRRGLIKLAKSAPASSLSAPFYLTEAHLAFLAGKTGEALTNYQKALSFSPQSPEALYGLSQLYIELGNTKEAASYLQKLEEEVPDATSF